MAIVAAKLRWYIKDSDDDGGGFNGDNDNDGAIVDGGSSDVVGVGGGSD